MNDKPINRLDVLAKAINGSSAIGVASILVLQANGKRTGATFVNDSDTVIYLRLGSPATINTGIRLNADGGAYEINLLNPWRGQVSAISTAGAKNLVWTETE